MRALKRLAALKRLIDERARLVAFFQAQIKAHWRLFASAPVGTSRAWGQWLRA